MLKSYINTQEAGPGRKRPKNKFIFKRDPRDISYLYFLDSATNQYHRISYRNTAHPAISVWEFRDALERAKQKGRENVNEEAIFVAYEEMKKVALTAVEQTRRVNKFTNRLVQGVPENTVAALLPVPTALPVIPAVSPVRQVQKERSIILPFDDLYDEALN